MKKKWVIINIETKSREFKSKVLLAKKLVETGYGVILINFRHMEDINGLPTGIFIDRNIFEVRKKVLAELKRKKFRILCLDEEGLVYLNKEKYLEDRIPVEIFRITDKFLCWGEEQFSIIASRYPEHSDKLFIVGNPRIDLLKKKYDRINKEQVKKIIDLHSPYILIVSNFSSVNMFNTPLEEEKRYLYHLNRAKKLKMIKNKKQEENFREYYLYINEIFNHFNDLVIEISTYFPNYNIIIRPHPSEDHKIWNTIAKEHSNVKVIYEETLDVWLKGAELVINNSCTSSIESLLLDRPCISYRPIKSKKYDQPLPNKVSKNVFSGNEVLSLIEKLEAENSIINEVEKKEYKTILEKHIFMESNKDSADYIVDIIDTIELEKKNLSVMLYKISNLNLLKKVKILISRSVYNGNKFLTKFFDEERYRGFYSHYIWNKTYEDHKIEDISKHEICDIISKINEIEDTNNKIKVIELKKNTFLLK